MSEPLADLIGNTFRLARSTGTHADVLTAVGLADVLAETVGDTRVDLGAEAQELWVEAQIEPGAAVPGRLTVSPGYPYLRARSTDPLPPGVVDYLCFESERERDRRYAAAREALVQARRKGMPVDPTLEHTVQENAPPEHWRPARVMYVLTNHTAPNGVHAYLAGRSAQERSDEVAAALRSLARGQQAAVGWKADSVQLFNPAAAKGYARLKPDSTNRNDRTKEQWTDPFIEWLRYRGYFRAGCPFFLGPRGEDIRLYTPIPARISLAGLRQVTADLRRQGIRASAPKLDILAVLRVAEFLIQHSPQAQEDMRTALEEALGFSLQDRTPAQVIEGLAITHYQSLGSAKVVSSIQVLAIPDWFPIRHRDDALEWIAILDEHRRVIRGLDDSHSDEIGLLLGYRRFLERRGQGAVDALLDFMGSYGPLLLRAWEAGRRMRVFRTHHLRRLLDGMAPQLSPIIADPGFEAIAQAVRRATVQAQFLKANGANDVREIRYDLLPELQRARRLGDREAFIQVVADFVARYNAENARRREMKKQAPANVRTEEFARFVRLVDEYGAGVVGALLCAYGTCVERRDETGEPEAPAEEETAGTDDTPEIDNATTNGEGD
jgi:hypothetical protein